MSDVCCFCKTKIEGDVNYCVPEDFPIDQRHELKPLCDTCGSDTVPTLNQICKALDNEQLAIDDTYLRSLKLEPSEINSVAIATSDLPEKDKLAVFDIIRVRLGLRVSSRER